MCQILILNNPEGVGMSLNKPNQKQYLFSYLPTPPLGQDMTQGQFLSGV